MFALLCVINHSVQTGSSSFSQCCPNTFSDWRNSSDYHLLLTSLTTFFMFLSLLLWSLFPYSIFVHVVLSCCDGFWLASDLILYSANGKFSEPFKHSSIHFTSCISPFLISLHSLLHYGNNKWKNRLLKFFWMFSFLIIKAWSIQFTKVFGPCTWYLKHFDRKSNFCSWSII